MNIDNLSSFLKIAKKNTYASELAEKAFSSRKGSKDYEYAEGDFIYHDTYFGGISFIGEEIVYEADQPIWGMNYNGHVVDLNVTEEEIDKGLRGALKQDYTNTIPVRGPKNYKTGNLEYKNNVTGTLERFEGREEIFRGEVLIYYAVYHGGLIK